MKISTKGQYALEIIADLALHSDQEHLESIKNIAGRRNLSVKYSERLMKEMKDALLVVSIRGAYGGYRLAKGADQITVKEVLQAVEGELAPVECLTRQTDCGINCDVCPTRGIWGEIWRRILSSTDQVTIGDIIGRAKKKGIDE